MRTPFWNLPRPNMTEHFTCGSPLMIFSMNYSNVTTIALYTLREECTNLEEQGWSETRGQSGMSYPPRTAALTFSPLDRMICSSARPTIFQSPGLVG